MSDITDPSKLDVFLSEFFWLKLLKNYYKNYVYSFKLIGDEKFLDFGCGPGSTSVHLAEVLIKSGELTCCDISEKWINRAKKHLKKYSNVRFYAEDMRQSTLNDGYFDCVNIHWMLHDIPSEQRPEVLKVLAAKLKPGGKVFIREPFKGHGIPIEEIRALMTSAGLNEQSGVIDKGMMGKNYTAIFIKK